MSRARVVLLAGVLVAVLVGSSIAIAIARSGPGDRMLWSAGPGGRSEPSTAGTALAWATTELLVTARQGSGTIVALAKADGSVRWTYRLPASGTTCDASDGIVRGAVAVAFRAGDEECRRLLLLQLGDGRPKWTVTLPETERLGAIELAGELIGGVVERPGGDVVAGFDPSSGARRWMFEPECQTMRIQPTDDGFAGGPYRIAFAGRCTQGGSHPSQLDEVRLLDPASGRQVHRLQLQGPVSSATIVAEAPLVVYESVSDSELGTSGGLVHVVKGAPGLWSPTYFEVGSLRPIGSHSDVVDDCVVVLSEGGWAAWDLRAGKQRWAHDRLGAEVGGVQVQADQVVGASKGGILLKGGTGEVALLRLNPRTGDVVPAGPLLSAGPELTGVWLVDGQRAYVVSGPGEAVAFRID